MKAKLFDRAIVSESEQAVDFVGNILESSTEYSINRVRKNGVRFIARVVRTPRPDAQGKPLQGNQYQTWCSSSMEAAQGCRRSGSAQSLLVASGFGGLKPCLSSWKSAKSRLDCASPKDFQALSRRLPWHRAA